MRGILLAVILSATACASSEEQADTMSLGAVDTLKPAGDSAGTVGTSVGTSTSSQATGQNPGTAKQSTMTKGGTAAGRDTTVIGRDRAIQPNTKDPRFRLPVIDTTKRPPR